MEAEARGRLLVAAERLLRERPYEQVSIRAVNKAAGMNPAAVHYHFGSKDGLVTALLEWRFEPLWRDRLSALDELARDPGAPAVAALAAILVEPMARLAADPDTRWLVGLLARLVLAGQELPWRSPWSGPAPWAEMVSRALPHLPPDVVADRWRLARDLVLVTYGSSPHEPPPPPAVVAFVAAGLGAPA